MKALKWIKDSFVSIILAIAGFASVLAVHFLHSAKAAKNKVKAVHREIQIGKAQTAAIIKADKERREREDAIQGDSFNPATDFTDRDK